MCFLLQADLQEWMGMTLGRTEKSISSASLPNGTSLKRELGGNLPVCGALQAWGSPPLHLCASRSASAMAGIRLNDSSHRSSRQTGSAVCLFFMMMRARISVSPKFENCHVPHKDQPLKPQATSVNPRPFSLFAAFAGAKNLAEADRFAP